MPTAPSTPMIVAINADANASTNVVIKASIICLFENRRTYQSKVKPPQTTLDRELLNDNTIRTKIGAYKNIIIRAI